MKRALVLVAGKNIDADCHNFGKKVETVERACGTWFRKPRTTHWEWLFFGKDSPLKKYFQTIGHTNHFPLADCIFNLEIEQMDDWFGYSRKVEAQSGVNISEGHFYSFGALLAYSFIFGIRDLHCGNLVMTSSHLQVVDVEVVLARLILPHESILLPFKQIPWEGSGIAALSPSCSALPS